MENKKAQTHEQVKTGKLEKGKTQTRETPDSGKLENRRNNEKT